MLKKKNKKEKKKEKGDTKDIWIPLLPGLLERDTFVIHRSCTAENAVLR